MAARGFARQPWETPTEYLRRALSGGASAATFPAGGLEPLRELTALAERARFSTLAVDEPMRVARHHRARVAPRLDSSRARC